MKLFVLSDLHLGAACSAWGRHGSRRREELRKAWTAAVDRILSPHDGAQALLVAGDLFDRPDPDTEDATAVMSGLERLAGAGKPVVLLPGIRDGAFTRAAFYNGTFPGGVTAVTWAETRCLLLGVGSETFRVHCRAPLPGRNAEPLLANDVERKPDAAFEVGLTYALPPALAADAPEVPEGLDLLVVGGKPDFESADTNGAVVISPGTPAASRPEQAGDRSWCIVELTRDGVTVEREPCDVPAVVSLEVPADILDSGEATGLARHLESCVPGSGLVLIHLTGETETVFEPGKLERIQDALPVPARIVDDSIPVGGPGADRERGLGARFQREIQVLRRDPDAAAETVFNRALRLGLKELRRLEECHAD